MNRAVLFGTAAAAIMILGLGCTKSDSNVPSTDISTVPAKITGLGLLDRDVELTIRNRSGETDNYVTSTYSFFHLTRDNVELTRNSWDLLASPGLGFGDSFNTEMVVGDIGRIVDLGEMSCKDIQNMYEENGEYPGLKKGGYPHKIHRQTDPKFWFQYSHAYGALNGTKTERVGIRKGHCYAIFKLSSDTKVVAVFSVKAHTVGESVVLSEIEVFDKARTER